MRFEHENNTQLQRGFMDCWTDSHVFVKPIDHITLGRHYTRSIADGRRKAVLLFAGPDRPYRIPRGRDVAWCEILPEEAETTRVIGNIEIPKIVVAHLEDLTADDIAAAGYDNHKAVAEAIGAFFNKKNYKVDMSTPFVELFFGDVRIREPIILTQDLQPHQYRRRS